MVILSMALVVFVGLLVIDWDMVVAKLIASSSF